MALRPIPARWFEALVARDDLALAVEALAATGLIQLEHTAPAAAEEAPDLQAQLERYRTLAQRFAPYWPTESVQPSSVTGRPARTMARALEELDAWRGAMEPAIQHLERSRAEQADLRRLRHMLAQMAEDRPDMGAVIHAGPSLGAAVYLVPPGARPGALPACIVPRWVDTPDQRYLLAVGIVGALNQLEQTMTTQQARRLALPSWLSGPPAQARAHVEAHLERLDTEITQLEAAIRRSRDEYRLPQVLGDIARLDWFVSRVRYFPASTNLAWVRGWTSDSDGRRLQGALHDSGSRALVHLVDPPPEVEAPMVLHNPRWARAFELFPRLLGIPAGYEADPSQLLALVAPLLFGYMFGDVGQGAVLLAGGWLLHRRYPFLRLLIPAGASAMIFGVLYGSVFSLETLIPALWIHPLADPLPVLAVPLAAGVVLLILGMLLNGLEARWRGAGRHWWSVDAPLLVLYAALLGLALVPAAGYLLVAAFTWYLIGQYQVRTGPTWSRIALALAELLENLFQLAVNTLSFTRVGAFALAHAGLSEAVGALAQVAGGGVGAVLIYIVGNVAILALEGLVVSIQTTRLILFEFFIRFLHGEGRPFLPLPAPRYSPESRTRSDS